MRAANNPDDPGAVAVIRRAPFSENPQVGARGQRTQQRILDAARRVFADEGYHRASIDRIAKVSGCSRVSFYQYFSGKDDVLRHLAGQVARQLTASTEALDPLTPNHEGWTALRAWVGRYAEIYARYEPVFNAYQLPAESDEVLEAVAARTGDHNIATIRSRLSGTTLSPRQVDPVLRLLVECLNHTLDVAGILRSASPEAYPSERLEVVATDVIHRTLFGLRAGVNVHSTRRASLPALAFGPAMLALVGQSDESATGQPAREALLASGHDVFVRRGYHNTRVDDIAAAAGVSHGVFYRYFRNKGDLARELTARAIRSTGDLLVEIPDVFGQEGLAGRGALRRWLRRYNAAHLTEAAMLRVWVDGALQDPTLRAELAPPLDWGRRRLSRSLRAYGVGGGDMEAVVMVALLGVFGVRPRPPAEVDAAAHIIQRGLLGKEQ